MKLKNLLITVITLFLIADSTYSSDEDQKLILEEFYNTLLTLHAKFHSLDREMTQLTEINPAETFFEDFLQPLRSKIKRVSQLLKQESSENNLSEIQELVNEITSHFANLEIQHMETLDQVDKIKENVDAKIKDLQSEITALQQVQNEANFNESLDALPFDPKNAHNISTQLEFQVLELTLGVIKDLRSGLGQLKADLGEPFDPVVDAKLSEEEVKAQLCTLVLRKKNQDLKPSNCLSKMNNTLDEVSEYFVAKISENYDIFNEEYKERSQKVLKRWKQIEDELKKRKITKGFEDDSENSIGKDEL